MQHIKSRMLQQLDKAIAAEPKPWAAACLKAQRAILHARHGQLEQAREQLTGLHQLAFQSPRPELGAWLHLAEGLMRYFTDFGSAAEDSIRHAADLAQAAQLRELEALAHAWLAHLAYTRHDIDSLVRHARSAADLATPADHAARGRLAMALGLAHNFSGQPERARAWYTLARKHAMIEGDDATQSALIYNMAQMRVAEARHLALALLVSAGPELMLGADSVHHYDTAVGSALVELTQLLRAQVLSLRGDFIHARMLYEQHLPQTLALGLERLGRSMQADLAWCCVNTTQPELALRHARDAEQGLAPDGDVDDRAATHSRLAQVYAALGDESAAQMHEAKAQEEWGEFGRQQKRWAEALAEAGLENA